MQGFLHNKENLKILNGKGLEKFVVCNELLWMYNWKVIFGQDDLKIDQKWPEMSKIFAKSQIWPHFIDFHANYGWPWIEKTHGQAKSNMATLAMSWPQLATLTYKQLKLDEEMCNKMPCYKAAMKISTPTQCFWWGREYIMLLRAFVKFTRPTSGGGENGLILLLQWSMMTELAWKFFTRAAIIIYGSP